MQEGVAASSMGAAVLPESVAPVGTPVVQIVGDRAQLVQQVFARNAEGLPYLLSVDPSDPSRVVASAPLFAFAGDGEHVGRILLTAPDEDCLTCDKAKVDLTIRGYYSTTTVPASVTPELIYPHENFMEDILGLFWRDIKGTEKGVEEAKLEGEPGQEGRFTPLLEQFIPLSSRTVAFQAVGAFKNLEEVLEYNRQLGWEGLDNVVYPLERPIGATGMRLNRIAIQILNQAVGDVAEQYGEGAMVALVPMLDRDGRVEGWLSELVFPDTGEAVPGDLSVFAHEAFHLMWRSAFGAFSLEEPTELEERRTGDEVLDYYRSLIEADALPEAYADLYAGLVVRFQDSASEPCIIPFVDRQQKRWMCMRNLLRPGESAQTFYTDMKDVDDVVIGSMYWKRLDARRPGRERDRRDYALLSRKISGPIEIAFWDIVEGIFNGNALEAGKLFLPIVAKGILRPSDDYQRAARKVRDRIAAMKGEDAAKEAEAIFAAHGIDIAEVPVPMIVAPAGDAVKEKPLRNIVLEIPSGDAPRVAMVQVRIRPEGSIIAKPADFFTGFVEGQEASEGVTTEELDPKNKGAVRIAIDLERTRRAEQLRVGFGRHRIQARTCAKRTTSCSDWAQRDFEIRMLEDVRFDVSIGTGPSNYERINVTLRAEEAGPSEEAPYTKTVPLDPTLGEHRLVFTEKAPYPWPGMYRVQAELIPKTTSDISKQTGTIVFPSPGKEKRIELTESGQTVNLDFRKENQKFDLFLECSPKSEKGDQVLVLCDLKIVGGKPPMEAKHEVFLDGQRIESGSGTYDKKEVTIEDALLATVERAAADQEVKVSLTVTSGKESITREDTVAIPKLGEVECHAVGRDAGLSGDRTAVVEDVRVFMDEGGDERKKFKLAEVKTRQQADHPGDCAGEPVVIKKDDYEVTYRIAARNVAGELSTCHVFFTMTDEYGRTCEKHNSAQVDSRSDSPSDGSGGDAGENPLKFGSPAITASYMGSTLGIARGIRFTANVEGGSGSYSTEWSVSASSCPYSDGCLASDSCTYPCSRSSIKESSSGVSSEVSVSCGYDYTVGVGVTVKDSKGQSASTSRSFSTQELCQ